MLFVCELSNMPSDSSPTDFERSNVIGPGQDVHLSFGDFWTEELAVKFVLYAATHSSVHIPW